MRLSTSVLAAAMGLALAGLPCAAADDNPSPVAGHDVNPALARFGRSVIFYVSFDGHANAEVAPGDPAPAGNAQWQAVSQNPGDLYGSGLFGQALRSGMHQLSYTCPKPVLGTAGSMAVWLKPELLHHRGTYCWPAILDSLEGRYRIMFGRIGNPANKETLYAHFSQGKVSVSATQQSMADWQPGRWHLFVVTWDRNGVELSVDGAPPTRASLAPPIEQQTAGGLRIHLLGQNEDLFLYDEFLVFGVPLNADEIRWLYECGMEKAKP